MPDSSSQVCSPSAGNSFLPDGSKFLNVPQSFRYVPLARDQVFKHLSLQGTFQTWRTYKADWRKTIIFLLW